MVRYLPTLLLATSHGAFEHFVAADEITDMPTGKGEDPDGTVRVQAIGVTGFLKLEESIPVLTLPIHHSHAHVRCAAMSALAFSQMKPAAETITRARQERRLDGA